MSEQIIEYNPSASVHPVPVEQHKAQKSGQHPHRNNIQSDDTRYAVRSRPYMEDSAQQHQESEEEPAQSHRTSEEAERSVCIGINCAQRSGGYECLDSHYSSVQQKCKTRQQAYLEPLPTQIRSFYKSFKLLTDLCS